MGMGFNAKKCHILEMGNYNETHGRISYDKIFFRKRREKFGNGNTG